MDAIRTIVSGKKNRYIEGKYNLDLTYVTPRIIAMAFPGSGIKLLYRNKINDVAAFLKEKHSKHFLVLNLSGIKYDYSKFEGNVIEYDNWPDHYSPPLELLFILIEKMHTYLTADKDNIIVVNCNAGKGRTGTLICCYLLFTGRFKQPQDAFDYYSLKRFNKGYGVTHASQKRYVNYFFQIISTRIIPMPKYRILKKIEITCYPFFSVNSFSPVAEIYKKAQHLGSFSKETIKLTPDEANNSLNITEEDINFPMCGDMLIELFDKGLAKIKLGRISFNVNFLDDRSECTFKLTDIDPYKFPIKNKVKDEYAIKLYFADSCKKDLHNTNLQNYCDDCKKKLWEEIANYKHFQEFLGNYKIEPEKSVGLLFGSKENDDVEKVLSKKNLLLTPKIDRREKEEKDKEVGCYVF